MGEGRGFEKASSVGASALVEMTAEFHQLTTRPAARSYCTSRHFALHRFHKTGFTNIRTLTAASCEIAFTLKNLIWFLASPTPKMVVPVIDLSNFDTNREQLVAQVGEACKNIGFFTIVNHGISKELINDLTAQADLFFKLPLEERMKLAKNHFNKKNGNMYRGYFPVYKQDETRVSVKEGGW